MADSVVIDDGLSIYLQPARSKYWFARILVNSDGLRYLRQTTREVDPEKAKIRAIELRMRLRIQSEAGVSLVQGRAFSFGTVCSKVVAEIRSTKPQRTTHKDYVYAIENLIDPAFGSRHARSVDAAALKQFFASLGPLSKTRLTIIRSCFTKLFDYCVTHKYLQQRDVPSLPSVSAKDKQYDVQLIDRDSFTAMLANYQGFLGESRKGVTRSYRQLLPAYMLFLYKSGVRPGTEALGIRYGDLVIRPGPSNGKVLMCRILNGKTSHERREIVLSDQSIQEVLRASAVNGYAPNDITKLIKKYPEKYIFRTLSQKKPDFEKTFEQFMDFLGDKVGHHFTLYSFRHTYINNQLAAGVPIHTIARQCGNSVGTIEKHYEKRKAQLDSVNHLDMVEISRLLSGGPEKGRGDHQKTG